jgi:organic radical activating enzyme
MSAHDAWNAASALADDTAVRMLVLTGGEPALQSSGLAPVAQYAIQAGWRVEVETAGAVDPGRLADLVDLLTVSPKLASSGVPANRRLNIENLETLAARSNVAWKFVIADEDDLHEADQLIADLRLREVLLMPQAMTADAVIEQLRWLVPEAAKRGHRVTPRLHTLLWGDERGR